MPKSCSQAVIIEWVRIVHQSAHDCERAQLIIKNIIIIIFAFGFPMHHLYIYIHR